MPLSEQQAEQLATRLVTDADDLADLLTEGGKPVPDGGVLGKQAETIRKQAEAEYEALSKDERREVDLIILKERFRPDPGMIAAAILGHASLTRGVPLIGKGVKAAAEWVFAGGPLRKLGAAAVAINVGAAAQGKDTLLHRFSILPNVDGRRPPDDPAIDPNDPLAVQIADSTDLTPEELEQYATAVQSGAPLAGIEGLPPMPTNIPGFVFASADTPTQQQIEQGTRPAEQIVSTDQKFADLFNLAPSQLQQLQTALFAAGYFNGVRLGGRDAVDVRFEDIDWGNPDDPATQEAWKAAIAAAESRFLAGQRLTVEQVIEGRSRSRGGIDAALEAEQEPAQVVTLSNPAEVGRLLDDVAVRVLGKEATNDQKRMAVALVHNLERQHAQQLAAAKQAQATTMVVQPPSAQVVAEQFLEEQDPEAAQGMSGAAAYRSFLGMLQAGGPTAA